MKQTAGIDLYWLPLGAGGHFVRFNGRVYEFFSSRLQHRSPSDIYHTALEVMVEGGRYVVENAWPIPNLDRAARGVTIVGHVCAEPLGHVRAFRYEVRCWRDGSIADIRYAVDSPQRLSEDPDQARALLALTGDVPGHVW